MANKTADAIKLNLRLPKPLHKRLKQQARRNNVSLNTEIVNQLQGHETATAARMAESLKPALDAAIKEAIEMAVYRTTRQSRNQVEAMLDMVVTRANPVRAEAELAERFRQMGFPDSDVVYFLQIFRERQAAKGAERRGAPLGAPVKRWAVIPLNNPIPETPEPKVPLPETVKSEEPEQK